MKNLSVHIAASGDDTIENVVIIIWKPLPASDYQDSGWADEARIVFDNDAKAIVEALRAALPGGTLDRVLIRLLQLKASLHRVPWDL